MIREIIAVFLCKFAHVGNAFSFSIVVLEILRNRGIQIGYILD